MSQCPQQERFKPLPMRRGFWRDLPKKIKEGTVLLAHSLPEIEDARNAAQAVLISHIELRLMSRFKAPVLKRGGDFYATFFTSYAKAIRSEELQIWEEIGCEVDQALAAEPSRSLTDKEAAYLTLAMFGHPEPPQSQELYMNLAVYARTYEELLREKYGERYTPAIFYRALREHMPRFMFELIAMDSVTSALLTINAKPRELADEMLILRPETTLGRRFMGLGEDDSFFFQPKFVEIVREHARAQDIREDYEGRTEDRGCPVLYATERDAILRFAIEELVTQHEHYNT